MDELLEACKKLISHISPSGDGYYYGIHSQDLKDFCDAVEAAEQSVQADGGKVMQKQKLRNADDVTFKPHRRRS